MPQIFNLMMKFEYELTIFYQNLGFEQIIDLLQYNETSTENFKYRINCNENSSEKDLNAAIGQLKVSRTVLFPLFIFASKKFITIDSNLNVNYEIDQDDIRPIIEILFLIILKNKLNKQYSTQTDLYRSPEIYSEAENQLHIFYRNEYRDKDDISKYRVNIAKL